MRITLAKWLITLVMMGVIITTVVVYWGATQLKGKLSIALTGVVINFGFAFWYSWLDRKPRSVKDWLSH